jgi:acetate kinase
MFLNKYYYENASSKLIGIHLGNACSSLLNGKYIDHSMGFPLNGLIMELEWDDIDHFFFFIYVILGIQE